MAVVWNGIEYRKGNFPFLYFLYMSSRLNVAYLFLYLWCVVTFTEIQAEVKGLNAV